MDQKDSMDHDALRKHTPTKVRTIFATPQNTLSNSKPESSLHPVKPIYWKKPASEDVTYDISYCAYQGLELWSTTEGLLSMKIRLESSRKCYSIYFELESLPVTTISVTMYLQGIEGVLITGTENDPVYYVDFALKSDVSSKFIDLKNKLNLASSNRFQNCFTLRVAVRNTNNLGVMLFKNHLFKNPEASKSKFLIKTASLKLAELDSFERELLDDAKVSAKVGPISNTDAISQFNSYSQSFSTPDSYSKRSYTSSTHSPDSVFGASMTSRTQTRKSKISQTVDLSNDNETLPAAGTMSPFLSGLRRSARILTQQVSSYSSKEFSYIDPDFDVNAKFLFSFPEGENDSVDISTYEEARLAPGVWLNDNLIDFDLKYIFSQLKHEIKPKVHIFNSFFYKRLCSATMPTTVSTDPERTRKTGYDSVRSWTRNTNIFDKDFIVIPICENMHWFLAIICYPKYMLSQPDVDIIVNLESDDEKAPFYQEFENKTVILIFDSLGLISGLKSNHVVNKLRSYLIHEAHDKGHGEAFWNSCTGFSVVVPRQSNFSDCGCFVLEYAERFLKSSSPLKTFQEILRSKGTPEGFSGWFAPSCASNRRSTLCDLIKSLAEDYAARAASRVRLETEDRSSDIEEIIL